MRKLGLSVLAVSFVFLPPSAFADDVGAQLFADYSAACHGPSGKGDGDMANVLTVKAPNLTQLEKSNDGFFPMLLVVHSIDGRTGLRSHASVMPLFGKTFSDDTGDVGYAGFW